MIKKIIRVKDPFEANITGCSSLKYVKGEVDRLITLFGENAEIQFDAGYNNISESIWYQREETDKEYVTRLKEGERKLKASKKNKESTENRERKEFERLKKKFGNE